MINSGGLSVKIDDDEVLLKWLLTHWNGFLDWDENNIHKLLKHKVTVEEVESIFDGDIAVIGRIIAPEGIDFGETRYLVLGMVLDKRHFAIVCTIRYKSKKLRPISCRRMRKNEEEAYEETKKIRLR